MVNSFDRYFLNGWDYIIYYPHLRPRQISTRKIFCCYDSQFLSSLPLGWARALGDLSNWRQPASSIRFNSPFGMWHVQPLYGARAGSDNALLDYIGTGHKAGCYDRIIVSLGMIACRRLGMPPSAIQTQKAESLWLMRYPIKHAYGISEDEYQGMIFEPLFGTGQGSGSSPAIWLGLLVVADSRQCIWLYGCWGEHHRLWVRGPMEWDCCCVTCSSFCWWYQSRCHWL